MPFALSLAQSKINHFCLELPSAFTEERAVTFPKKTLFPLAGNGSLLNPSTARASNILPRS
jgi:hypothetical protein